MTEISFLKPSCPTLVADVILVEADTWSRFSNIMVASSRVIFDSVTVGSGPEFPRFRDGVPNDGVPNNFGV